MPEPDFAIDRLVGEWIGFCLVITVFSVVIDRMFLRGREKTTIRCIVISTLYALGLGLALDIYSLSQSSSEWRYFDLVGYPSAAFCVGAIRLFIARGKWENLR